VSKEDIIRKAEEDEWIEITQFVKLAVLQEREACAKVCDEAAESMTQMAQWGAQTCGKLIKARGQA
jgi:hypothetical protein